MNLKKQAISGATWTGFASIVLAITQILRLSILTRFLDKSDFGLVAIVILILGFTQIFTDLGISVSLLSRHDISKKQYSSLYWVSILLAIILYIAIILAAPIIATFYREPELKLLIPIMGLDLLIATAGRQFRIFKQKELKFKSLALLDISTAALSLVVAVVFAQAQGGAWSIVYSTITASFVSSFVLIISGLRSHPIIWYLNLNESKSFYKVGLFQTGSQILDYISSQIDIIIIGKLMGTTELGSYNLTKQLIMRILGLINPTLTRVFIPILATLNHDHLLLKDNYRKMLNTVAFINFAIYGIVALCAKEILTIIYGSSFSDVAVTLQVLCIWGGVVSVMSCASSLIVITGKTELGFRWTAVRILANPAFVWAGYQYGIIGIALAQCLYIIVFYNFYWILVIRKILSEFSYLEYIKTISNSFLAFITLLTILIGFKMYINNSLNIWLSTLFFAVLYLTGYLLMNRRIVRSIVNAYLKRR